MVKLSVVIITFNEEHNIERCLKSVVNIADEIVVVDSFSTDNTSYICKKYNVNFVQNKWLGYSKQKNKANSLSNNDYILSIDADEAVSKELEKSILEQKKIGFSGCYKINRFNNYCGKWIKHTSWYPDTKIRIWNRNEAIWKGDIHETVEFLEKNMVVKQLKGDLLHYSYTSIHNHIEQANKFSSIAAQIKYEQGKSVGLIKIIISPFFKFIKEYFIKLGLLDGIYGFVISVISAHETFLKYIKLYHKINSK